MFVFGGGLYLDNCIYSKKQNKTCFSRILKGMWWFPQSSLRFPNLPKESLGFPSYPLKNPTIFEGDGNCSVSGLQRLRCLKSLAVFAHETWCPTSRLKGAEVGNSYKNWARFAPWISWKLVNHYSRTQQPWFWGPRGCSTKIHLMFHHHFETRKPRNNICQHLQTLGPSCPPVSLQVVLKQQQKRSNVITIILSAQRQLISFRLKSCLLFSCWPN